MLRALLSRVATSTKPIRSGFRRVLSMRPMTTGRSSKNALFPPQWPVLSTRETPNGRSSKNALFPPPWWPGLLKMETPNGRSRKNALFLPPWWPGLLKMLTSLGRSKRSVPFRLQMPVQSMRATPTGRFRLSARSPPR
ncbi:hypothetical protein B0H10DRAFT_1986684, partial [Mycena sp. CBHHK59/15]